MTEITSKNKTDLTQEQKNINNIIKEVLAEARKQGADQAEVGVNIENGFTVNVRMGEIDVVEHHQNKGIGITVYFGKHKGSASSSDLQPDALREALLKACNIAKFTSEDPFTGLADKALMAFDYPDLDLYHPWAITPEQAIEMAKECEEIGRSKDKRIINSEGASISTHQALTAYGNTHGFIGSYPSTHHSITLVLIAKEGDSMERDYSYSVACDALNLDSLQKIANDAVTKTTRRLKPSKLKTCTAPIIFEREIAAGLLSHFLTSLYGGNLYRRSSFMLGQLGQAVLPKQFTLHENPYVLKGLGSSPFDAEGVTPQERDIVKDGILQGYILGSYSGRKLGMQTTGNAGGNYNIDITTTHQGLPDLLNQMQRGLLVTEVMGQGVNIVTGDYSRGAVGFWVEDGQIQYPVSEITIAGNLKHMLGNIAAIGHDIDYRRNLHTGSILLEEMMIAGE